jgi:dephospho-CoA kinase
MLKIGLTGGIGSGKSTVADLFAAKGVPVLDADQVARDLVEPGRPAFQAIVGRFGPQVLREGRLDRLRLRQRVFAAPGERRWLESLLHPGVYEELRRRAEGLDAPYCLLAIPLLLETGRRDFVDRLLVVDCPMEAQRQRIMSRDGASPEFVERMLATQIDREGRLAAADDILDNSGALRELAEPVERLHRRYLSLAGAAPPGQRLD